MAISAVVIIAIVAGATLTAGGISIAGINMFSSEALVNKKIKEVKEQIKNCKTVTTSLTNLKGEITNILDCVNESQSYLLQGGHVLNGKSLPDEEYTTCKSNLKSASGEIDNIITVYNAQLKDLNAKLKSLEETLKAVKERKLRLQKTADLRNEMVKNFWEYK